MPVRRDKLEFLLRLVSGLGSSLRIGLHLLPILARITIQGNDRGFFSLVDKALVNPDSAGCDIQRFKQNRRWGGAGLEAGGLRDRALCRTRSP